MDFYGSIVSEILEKSIRPKRLMGKMTVDKWQIFAKAALKNNCFQGCKS